MLAHRQEFHMGESEIAHIGGKLGRELAIGEPTPALQRVAPPGGQVHLVDGGRSGARCGRGTVPIPTTIEAVCGLTSAANATGSDLSGNIRPSAAMISYL